MTGDRFCSLVLDHTDPPGVRRLVDRIRTPPPKAEMVVRPGEWTLLEMPLFRATPPEPPARSRQGARTRRAEGAVT